MAIVKNGDGCLNFCIKAEDKFSGLSLQSIDDYVYLLNDLDYGAALINREGTITSPDVQGVFIKKKDGRFAVIPGQEFNPVVFRGQCNDYPFMPSSKRYELFDPNERIRHSVEWIKKNEFIRLIKTTPYYKRTKEFEVLSHKYEYNTEAIAKQYNFVSDNIDVTRNLMVAYFFAYTYYDEKTGERKPLEGFDYNSPMLYIGSLRDLYYKAQSTVKDLSFQAIVAAKAQQTLSLNIPENWDYVKTLFRKIELPKDTRIAKNVYEQFDYGRRLLPPDYASKCAKLVSDYNTLQDDLVAEYCEMTKTNEVWLREEYEKLGYEIVKQEWNVPETAHNIINKEIDDYILPYLNSNFIFRGVKQGQ